MVGDSAVVHALSPVPEALKRLAGLQAGVVSRQQALGTGLGNEAVKRLVRTGSWVPLSSGVYFTATLVPPWLAWAWAGVLIAGDQARLGGRAAGHLYGLVVAPPALIPVLTPGTTRPRVQGPWQFTREQPGQRWPRSVGAPPRLTVEDCVLDLVAQETNSERVVGWVTASVQARLTTPLRLRRALQRRTRLRHRALLLELLDEVAEGARSPLEVRYLRDVERAHGLPAGARQAGRRRTEVDVLYDDYGLLVELDGRRGHEDEGRFRDMRRDNWSTTDGLATLRYGYADVVGRPCEVAAQVAQNLFRRGWSGLPNRCGRCRRAA
jgi:hypothetical protein